MQRQCRNTIAAYIRHLGQDTDAPLIADTLFSIYMGATVEWNSGGCFMRTAWLIAACLLAACSRHGGDKLEFSGTVETREIQTGSKVGGRVSSVLVVEGQKVSGGTVMVRFDAAELEAMTRQLQARVAQAEADAAKLRAGFRPEEIEQAEAAARTQRAQLEALREGPRTQEIEQAEAELAAAQAEAANAQRNYARIEQLHKTGDVSNQARDDARTKNDAARARAESVAERVKLLHAGTRKEDVKAGEARYQQAAASAQLMRKGYRREDIAAAEGRLREAKALLDETRVRLAEGEVRAPDSCGQNGCLVEVVSVRPGDVVTANRAVATLLEPSQLWVRIFVPEPELGRIGVGQKANIRVDSFSDRTFTGAVEQIASRSEFLPRNIQTREDRDHQVFGIKIRVDNHEGALKSGMAATVRLEPKS
jgi:HlyD family secretion protein